MPPFKILFPKSLGAVMKQINCVLVLLIVSLLFLATIFFLASKVHLFKLKGSIAEVHSSEFLILLEH